MTNLHEITNQALDLLDHPPYIHNNDQEPVDVRLVGLVSGAITWATSSEESFSVWLREQPLARGIDPISLTITSVPVSRVRELLVVKLGDAVKGVDSDMPQAMWDNIVRVVENTDKETIQERVLVLAEFPDMDTLVNKFAEEEQRVAGLYFGAVYILSLYYSQPLLAYERIEEPITIGMRKKKPIVIGTRKIPVNYVGKFTMMIDAYTARLYEISLIDTRVETLEDGGAARARAVRELDMHKTRDEIIKLYSLVKNLPNTLDKRMAIKQYKQLFQLEIERQDTVEHLMQVITNKLSRL